MSRFPALSLSVVMPAYDEEANIGVTIPRAVASLERMVGSWELLLVDDASRDRTGALADELAARHPGVRVVHNPVNLRQGGCLRRAFALARCELVTHDAMDYPFDLDDLPALLEHFPAADVVVAARKSYPNTSAPRRFVSAVNRTLLRALFGVPVSDYNFIQVYKRSVLAELAGFSTATSFITAEKIIRASRGGLRVVEVPTEYHGRLAGKPSSANWRNIRRALVDMGRLWWELRRERERGS